jgi:hypothetical protein
LFGIQCHFDFMERHDHVPSWAPALPAASTWAIRDIEPFQWLAAHFVGQGRAVSTIKALHRYGPTLKAARTETEAAPIRYVAELLGADTDSEGCGGMADCPHGRVL